MAIAFNHSPDWGIIVQVINWPHTVPQTPNNKRKHNPSTQIHICVKIISKKKKGRVSWKWPCATTLPDFSAPCVLETCKCLVSNERQMQLTVMPE